MIYNNLSGGIFVNIGASSACFYPLETEKSIVRAGETGVKTIEIFMNADSEFEPAFVKNMADIQCFIY